MVDTTRQSQHGCVRSLSAAYSQGTHSAGTNSGARGTRRHAHEGARRVARGSNAGQRERQQTNTDNEAMRCWLRTDYAYAARRCGDFESSRSNSSSSNSAVQSRSHPSHELQAELLHVRAHSPLLRTSTSNPHRQSNPAAPSSASMVVCVPPSVKHWPPRIMPVYASCSQLVALLPN